MSKLKNELMEKINNDQIKMRSKNFFRLSKAIVEVALIALVLGLVFVVNLSFYLPRKGMGRAVNQDRLGYLLGIIPWYYVLIGAAGLAVVIWLLYRHTGVYKKHFLLTITMLSVLILIAGFLISISKINEKLEGQQGMKHFYRYGQQGGNGQHKGPGYNQNR